MFVLKKWVRAALILKARVDKKQKHTHIRRQFCMEVAFKLQARKGEFQMLDSKKNETFNEFYYIAFTQTRKNTPNSLVKTMASFFLKRISWLT